jgi:tetratricopeptide (TPR) repeat protein
MDRLSMLLSMVSTKPNDPFPRYGLAMEYKKLGRNDDAVQAFAELAVHHPKYVPGYLMHGNLLESMGRGAEAHGVYDRGLEVARAAGDDHAESELRAARDALA